MKKYKEIIFVGLIVLLVLGSFFPVLSAGFLNWDDLQYVVKNEAIQEMSWHNLKEIFFKQKIMKTYVPLTVFTFALEKFLFGLNPFVFHLTNLLLHMVVVMLCYWFLKQIGIKSMAVYIAIVLFAVHTIHVESVAWVSERKDVLYAAFYMLSLNCYWLYLSGSKYRYLIFSILAAFLSVLAKPMALSLPLVLILCDWYKNNKLTFSDFFQKIPYCLVIGPVVWQTYMLHVRIPGQSIVEGVTVWMWTFGFYIQKFFLPIGLSPLYEAPEPVSFGNVPYLVGAVIFVVSLILIIVYRKIKWFIFGAMFYFLSIFFIFRMDTQTDLSVVADRFNYLPSLGLCILVGQVFSGFLQKQAKRNGVQEFGLFLVCIIGIMISINTHIYCSVWGSSVDLWTRAIQFAPNSAEAYHNRGGQLSLEGRFEEAKKDMDKAIAINPQYASAYNNRGVINRDQGLYSVALLDFDDAILLDPFLSEAYNNRGLAYSRLGQSALAVADYSEALKINPAYVKAYRNRANEYYEMEYYSSALKDYSTVLNYVSDIAEVYNSRGSLYERLKDYERASRDYSQAIAIAPDYISAYNNRGNVYLRLEKYDLALGDYNLAIKLESDSAETYSNRGSLFLMKKEYEKALKDYNQALTIDPEFSAVYLNRSYIYEAKKEYSQALEDLNKAQELGMKVNRRYKKKLLGLVNHGKKSKK